MHRLRSDSTCSLSNSPLDILSAAKPRNAKGVQNGPVGLQYGESDFSTETASDASFHELSAFHPASSLLDFLDSFGPLIFPLYRMALLRKRILFSGQAPVEQACRFGKSILHLYHLEVMIY